MVEPVCLVAVYLAVEGDGHIAPAGKPLPDQAVGTDAEGAEPEDEGAPARDKGRRSPLVACRLPYKCFQEIRHDS